MVGQSRLAGGGAEVRRAGRLRGECGDRVDLDQLVLESEDGHSEKRARWPVGRELPSDRLPCRAEVVLSPDHVDGDLDEVFRTSLVVFKTVSRLWTVCSVCVRRSPTAITDPSLSRGQAPAVKRTDPAGATAAYA
jgi:hypothetical protein